MKRDKQEVLSTSHSAGCSKGILEIAMRCCPPRLDWHGLMVAYRLVSPERVDWRIEALRH